MPGTAIIFSSNRPVKDLDKCHGPCLAIRSRISNRNAGDHAEAHMLGTRNGSPFYKPSSFHTFRNPMP